MPAVIDRETLMAGLVPLALEAGRVVMAHYQGTIEVRAKADQSPVTAADEAAEAVILEGLDRLTPDIPVVAEERAAAGDLPAIGARFWLVDPLDGTREFIGRNGEFTVNIALVENGAPVLGVVLAPALDRLFHASGPGRAVEARVGADGTVRDARPIAARAAPASGLTVVASRSHRDAATETLIKGLTVADFRAAGSSLKFCLVAAGEADFYPRTGRTMEWDTAAGHAIALAAGGAVMALDAAGRTMGPLTYGKPGFENPGFICRGR